MGNPTTDQGMLRRVLTECVTAPDLHARLLNTFAYLENVGARKIHRFQRLGFSGAFVLKHAAEEARHAWHFKQQINLTGGGPRDDFAPSSLLGGFATRHYLRRLDLAVNRYLREVLGQDGREQFITAYLLVTLVIELRANQLYPTYAKVLKEAGSAVKVQSIINEERRHLAEIEALLRPRLGAHLAKVVEDLSAVEASLYQSWLLGLRGALPGPAFGSLPDVRHREREREPPLRG